LVDATEWISSTISQRTGARILRAALVRMRNSDSGVVIRMSGGCLSMDRRTSAGVSPVRIATEMSGGTSPCDSIWRRIPTSGERRLRSTSWARAFSGDT